LILSLQTGLQQIPNEFELFVAEVLDALTGREGKLGCLKGNSIGRGAIQ
jgi:hypothetical protein